MSDKLTACRECEFWGKNSSAKEVWDSWNGVWHCEGFRPICTREGQWCDDVNTDGHCPHFKLKEGK